MEPPELPAKARIDHDKSEGEQRVRPERSTSQAQASARGGLVHASTAKGGKGGWGVGRGVGRVWEEWEGWVG